MASEDLVRMANQIALFFAPYPEDEAVAGVTDHLHKFWAPAMRNDLTAIVERGSAEDGSVHPLVVQAVRQLTRTHEA